MVSTSTISSIIYERRVERIHKYRWPAVQLNVWILIMLISSCTLIGIFATFIQDQKQLLLGIPWYFPYMLTVASLAIIFVAVILALIFQRRLLPSIVMIGGFVMFVLWLVGLIVLSIELWGPSGSVNSHCNLAVFNQNPKGQTLTTLAWMAQKSICQAWQAAFAFAFIGTIFLLWIMVISFQVFAGTT